MRIWILILGFKGLTYVETYNNIDKRSHSVIEKRSGNKYFTSEVTLCDMQLLSNQSTSEILNISNPFYHAWNLTMPNNNASRSYSKRQLVIVQLFMFQFIL